MMEDKHGCVWVVGSCVVVSDSYYNFSRVGVALDAWMHPLEESVCPQVTQPLLCVNSDGFHWQQNIDHMLRLDVNTGPQNNNVHNTTSIGIPDACWERILITMK